MNQTTAPGAPAPQKQGMSTLAKIGIGCGVLILIGVLILVIGGMFAAKKVKEMAENPATSAGKVIAALDDNVEFVSADEEKKTVTLKEKDSGKVVTLDLADVKDGKISFRDEEGEEVTFEASGDGESGSMKIHTSEGDMTFQGGSKEKLPEWVPGYPGAESEGVYTTKTPDGVTGTAMLKTDDSVEKVMGYYEKEFEKAGFQLSKTTHEHPGHEAEILTCIQEKTGRYLQVTARKDETAERSEVSLSYQETAKK